MLTLLELCCNQVAIMLWETRKPLEMNYDIDLYFWQTEASLLQKCDLLEICQTLKPLIKTKVKDYSEKVFDWTKFVVKRLNLLPLFAMDICWTANGGEVDYERTYFKSIAPNVCGYTNFRVASELCLGEVAEYILVHRYRPRHRDEVCMQSEECAIFPKNDLSIFGVESLFKLFWRHKITKSNSINCDEIYRHLTLYDLENRSDNIKATLFTIGVVSRNVLAVRYFWSELEPFTRWLIIRGLPEVVTRVHILLELKFIGYCRTRSENVRRKGEHTMFEFKIVPEDGIQATPHLMEGQISTETRKPFQVKALQYLERLNIIKIKEIPVNFHPQLL